MHSIFASRLAFVWGRRLDVVAEVWVPLAVGLYSVESFFFFRYQGGGEGVHRDDSFIGKSRTGWHDRSKAYCDFNISWTPVFCTLSHDQG
jgi:hypothetical protein